MAALSTDVHTLATWAKLIDPDGQIDAVAELLSEKNEILDDMLFLEGNLPTGHQSTQRTGLPSGTWRRFNEGVARERSTSRQVTDTVGFLETYSEVDKALADLNGNTAAFRVKEDKAFIMGLSQTFATTLMYNNTDTNDREFMGFAPRFNDLASGGNKANIIDAGGTGSDNSSVWLVGWGDHSVHGFFPKGSRAGLEVEDLGQVTLQDSNNDQYEGYRTHYVWKAGLAVPDWRYIVRIVNIDNSLLLKDAASGADLVDLFVIALETIEDLTTVKPAFYVNRTIRQFLRRQIKNSNNVRVTPEGVAGKSVLSFDEVPVRRVDKLTSAEAQVT